MSALSLFEQLSTNPNLFVIAGPCVIESEQHALKMAQSIKDITDELGLIYIFKSSFDKANRTNMNSYRGPGLEEGLKILKKVKDIVGVSILTDVHEPWQCEQIAKVVDIIQIPAFLCRQTDLIIAAAKTGKIVNVKKGQFCSSSIMTNACEKIKSVGNNQIILTERGSTFGYGDLVVDMRNLKWMKQNEGVLVVQDITHSLQQPVSISSTNNTTTNGLRDMIPTIARASVAAGVDGIFMEVHDEPENAKSDSSTQWYLNKTKDLLQELQQIHVIVKSNNK